MSRKAKVFYDKMLAGYLEKTDKGDFVFRYHPEYFGNPEAPAISLSFPKKQMEYQSQTLFPFFFGLLSEGVNKQTQCRLLKIDENDHFTLLLRTAGTDTIGAITVKAVEK